MTTNPDISIPLNTEDKARVDIFTESKRLDSIRIIDETEAHDNGESPYQLMEGCTYEYVISSDKYKLVGTNGIVTTSRRKVFEGRIITKIFVGTLYLDLLEIATGNCIQTISLEVRSHKSDYRTEYRSMLATITEKCTELIMQCNSPVYQSFTSDSNVANETDYQRFAFVHSLLSSNEFNDAIQKVISSPVTQWKENIELTDIRRVKRIRNSGLRQIASNPIRTKLPEEHPLRDLGLNSIPSQIRSSKKIEDIDTPENRFIKHVLEVFLRFCVDFEYKAEKKAKQEAKVLVNRLENYLNHGIFKQISRPASLKLNSPILQRKEGYREVLRAWLMFDMAAKLIWEGGEDVYEGGNRDVATLYEYWLFFTLLELFSEIFSIQAKSLDKLIKTSSDGLSLQLKQGKETALRGIYDSGTRKLNIRYSFNRSFSGNKPYPDSGSWTRTLRPDYTLSIWPVGLKEKEAEVKELITHIHFDAKYKVENLKKNFTEDVDLDEEKKDQREGKYKNADLLKMHAYKDAIRRTGGAYVLYPGGQEVRQEGFHEIIPGLGAFPIGPSDGENGTTNLKKFIEEIIEHFLNRASQYENMSSKIFDVHQNPEPNELCDSIPDYFNGHKIVPDETTVLVGYYNSSEHLKWYNGSNIYNFRMGSGNGSLELTSDVINSKYLLLHTKGDQKSGELWKVKSKGVNVYSKENLKKKGYPTEPSSDYYLVISIEKDDSPEFKEVEWDFKELEHFKNGHQAAAPFAISLTELMQVKTPK